MNRIYLSPPDVGPDERSSLLDAFDSNWIAPVGDHLDAFETELVNTTHTSSAVAVTSGTAALHLALILAGVGQGSEVIVPSLTFVATANAVTYTGARPVFIDSEAATWNLDPELLAEELATRSRNGDLPAAVIAVDLYGQCADYSKITSICEYFEVPLIEDAAEALGATHKGQPAGSFGLVGVLSFNGNKIITTSSGGALVSRNEKLIEAARHLANQARDDAPHYEHSKTGFNYRMSNLLAAVGRAQLRHLDEKVERRKAINARYRDALSEIPGIDFMPNPDDGGQTNWLTVITIDPESAGVDRETVRLHLESADIEARPSWKPLHLQPLFSDHKMIGGPICESVFANGLCLPSGSSMTIQDQDRVITELRSCFSHAG